MQAYPISISVIVSTEVPCKFYLHIVSTGVPCKCYLHTVSTGVPCKCYLHIVSTGVPCKCYLHIVNTGVPCKCYLHINHHPNIFLMTFLYQLFQVVLGSKIAIYSVNIFSPISVVPSVCLLNYWWNPNSVYSCQV